MYDTCIYFHGSGRSGCPNVQVTTAAGVHTLVHVGITSWLYRETLEMFALSRDDNSLFNMQSNQKQPTPYIMNVLLTGMSK